MTIKTYLLSIFSICFLFACDTGTTGDTATEGVETVEAEEEPTTETAVESKITATINGEEWKSYNVQLDYSEEGMEIEAGGYLPAEARPIPATMHITVVGLPEGGEITTPYRAYFVPNTQENAAVASIRPDDMPEVYETELDPNAEGAFVITEATGSSISGEFNFIATDKNGRTLKVENGTFTNLSLQ